MMKIAVVGCGTMGRVHGAELTKMPDVQLVGMHDIQDDIVQELSSQYGTKAFTDFDRMITETDPDIVNVCLPTPMHKEYVMRAARYGKHVICEKPMALTLQDAEEMIEFCEGQGVRLFIGHVVRFFPSYADIRRKAADGAIGRAGILHASRMGSHPGKAKNWYYHSDRSGGVILDLMIHDIDFAQSLFGKAASVFAMRRKTKDMEYALVTIRFEEGQLAHLEGYWGFPGPFTTNVELSGSGGVIRFNSEDAASLRMFKQIEKSAAAPTVVVPKSPFYKTPYYLELEHFIQCVRTGGQPEVTEADALNALRIGLAAVESASSGQPVRLSGWNRTSQQKGGQQDV